jgi:hypothetical protein
MASARKGDCDDGNLKSLQLQFVDNYIHYVKRYPRKTGVDIAFTPRDKFHATQIKGLENAMKVWLSGMALREDDPSWHDVYVAIEVHDHNVGSRVEYQTQIFRVQKPAKE